MALYCCMARPRPHERRVRDEAARYGGGMMRCAPWFARPSRTGTACTCAPRCSPARARRAAARRGLKKTPLEYIRDNLWVTTSGNWYEPALVCTMMAMGVDKILFAADWPYEANSTATEFLHKVSISDGDRAKIAHANVERLLRL